jgi:hypothetical protein
MAIRFINLDALDTISESDSDNFQLNKLYRTQKTARLTKHEQSNVYMLILLIIISSFFSLIFSILIFVWTLASGYFLLKIVNKQQQIYPNTSNILLFQRKFHSWITNSAPWVTAMSALLTIIVQSPQFGITAILLNTILLLRFQKISASMGLKALPRSILRENYNSIWIDEKRTSKDLHLWFLLSDHGLENLMTSLTSLGIQVSSFSLVGRADRYQFSIIINAKGDERKILLRVFNQESAQLRDFEYELRKSIFNEFFAAANIRKTKLANYPAIIVEWNEFNPGLKQPSKSDITKWGRQFELFSAQSASNEQRTDLNHLMSAQDSLVYTIEKLSGIDGVIKKTTPSASEIVNNAFKYCRDLPVVWGFQSSFRLSNFLSGSNGSIEPLDLTDIELGLLGSFGDPGDENIQYLAKCVLGITVSDLDMQKFRVKLKIVHKLGELKRNSKTIDFTQIDKSISEIAELTQLLNDK